MIVRAVIHETQRKPFSLWVQQKCRHARRGRTRRCSFYLEAPRRRRRSCFWWLLAKSHWRGPVALATEMLCKTGCWQRRMSRRFSLFWVFFLVKNWRMWLHAVSVGLANHSIDILPWIRQRQTTVWITRASYPFLTEQAEHKYVQYLQPCMREWMNDFNNRAVKQNNVAKLWIIL